MNLKPLNDPVPDNRNRLAFIIGRIFHPYVICIPTLFVVLSDLSWDEALNWSLIVIAIVLLPGMTLAAYLQRRGHPLYERRTRTPLYIVGWGSVLTCILVIRQMGAPQVLVFSLITLAIWAPLQLSINTFITKVSAHAAIAAGCAVGLLLLGKLETLPIQVLVLAIVIVTIWARVVTHNHTILQVSLGLIVGALPPLIVFTLMQT
jgi:membrane-associated phospholipid phosphatase